VTREPRTAVAAAKDRNQAPAVSRA